MNRAQVRTLAAVARAAAERALTDEDVRAAVAQNLDRAARRLRREAAALREAAPERREG